MALANGSPSMIAASTQPSGRIFLKLSISDPVHFDAAAAGEHSTMRKREVSGLIHAIQCACNT